MQRSATAATIRFTDGTCTLHASPTALTLQVDAADEDSLRRLQAGITRRVETIGRREHLTADWQRPGSTPAVPTDHRGTAPPAGPATAGAAAARRPRRLGRTIAVAVFAVLAVLAHLGLLGGAIATSGWAGWGIDIVLAIILLKLLVVAAHLVLARLAGRRHGLVGRFRSHLSSGTGSPTGTHEP